MEFPLFHLDFLNNRILIAVIAILHVLINHPLAVGGIPLVTLLEWQGSRSGDARWDELAQRIMKTFFLITTTVGALTGVGIWFSTSLVNPVAIGSLIRVFFWAWFTEWLVFVTEVALIMVYFLSWKRSLESPEAKKRHIRWGIILSIASWITMVLIVAILSFMMDPGNWMSQHTLVNGFFNPIYAPQLAFRTTLAMLMAGTVVLSLTGWFCRRDEDLRLKAVSLVSRWSLIWLPLCAIASYWYWQRVPGAMRANLATAVATQAFSNWHEAMLLIMITGLGIVLLLLTAGAMTSPGFRVPRYAAVVPALVLAGCLGSFERVREFIRKPYAIGQYMYSNGIRVQEYPLLQRDGLLAHATYTPVREITSENELQAGQTLFTLTCTRCHTVNGVNSIRVQLNRMYGKQPWEKDKIAQFISTLHTSRSYMPPFPGNARERQALAAYLVSLQTGGQLPGAQSVGIGQLAAPPAYDLNDPDATSDPTQERIP